MSLILVVEDKESMAQMLSETLKVAGYQVLLAKDGREASQRLKEKKVDLVLTDLKLPHKGGLEVLHESMERNPLTPVILMTAFGTVENAVKAVKEGAYDFLTKPVDPDHLLLLMEKALEKQKLLKENMVLRDEFSGHLKFPTIIGKSPPMVQLFENIQKVSQSHSTVLLLGESGTGKELFARAIHYLSPRKDGPFVAVNCAAIPRELLETEFFGHERGAFTGAVGKKMGKFELADKGTIFMDEIGDLDLSLQAKLLRVLEGSEFTRVGGTTRLKMDVRVVAATNKQLQPMVSKNTFREDLYYRLSVFPLIIPPLRERREDIPALVEHFLNYYSRETKKEIMGMTPDGLKKLMNHPWTGNVRELQNCIERAVILTEGKQIGLNHLGLNENRSEQNFTEIPFEGTLQQASAAATRYVESQMIRKVLKDTGGNKTKAAEILQVSYKTLLTKIKEYDIEKPNHS
ncbi:MAG TPA: sigma-54 dependent transcriptional regulator [Nitrospiria bacterium]|jgi:DNA-binding NtrC family response regulator